MMYTMFLKCLEEEFDKWFARNFPDINVNHPMYGKIYKREASNFFQTLLKYHGDYKQTVNNEEGD